MSEPRGGRNDRSPLQRQASLTSPRSPVKLEDYANIRRPPQQQRRQQGNQEPDAVTNADGKSPFQRELEGALKERKKRGLVTGFSDSEHSVDDVEHDNNNVVSAGYFEKVDQNDNDQWQRQHNDSIPFSSDVSLNQSNDGRGANNDNGDLYQQHTDRSLSHQSSLYEFENLETVMNLQSQSSTGLLDVLEESSENGAKNGSRGDTLRGSDVATSGSGLDGDILHLDNNDGSGLMSENELREQGVLFDESSSTGSHDDNFHGEDNLLPPEDSNLVMNMYMQASPRPPVYPKDEYENSELSEQSDEDYIIALKQASVDDIAQRLLDGGLSEDDYEEESIPSEYSDNASVEDLHQNGDVNHRTNGHSSEPDNENYDMQLRTSKNSNHRTNGHVNGLEPTEFGNQSFGSPSRLSRSRQSHVSDLSQEDSEFGSPELGNTVVENKGHLNAAILAAAARIESFVEEPEGESDGTSVSLGQFVPNSVQRTRLPPPGQMRSSVKGYRRSSIEHQDSKPSSVSASKTSSPGTTPRTARRSTSPRKSNANSVHSKSGTSSPRGSVRSVSQYSEKSVSQYSERSVSQYSEKSARSEVAEYLAAAAERSSSQSVNDLPTEFPTLMSMYLGTGKGYAHYPRPEGVPPLDFGASINSNISFLPRDDDKARAQAEEFADALQQDYDDLLAKYAQAENTIDQLRLGAKVNLFGDDPVPGQAVQGSHAGAKQPGVIQFGQPQNASVRQVININHSHTSTGGGDGGQLTAPSARTPHSPFRHTIAPPTPRSPFMQTIIPATGHGGNRQGAEGDLEFPLEASAGGKAMALMFQAKDLQEQVDAFDDLIKQNQITAPEQKTAYDHLKSAQEKLESEYMQAKEEDNAMRRRNSIFNNGDEDLFDPEREVEGQIFQLGMKLDDIHGVVMENLRNQPVEIQKPPSVQEIFQPEIEARRPDVVDQQTGGEQTSQGTPRPSSIPVLRRNNPEEPQFNNGEGIRNGEEGELDEEEESPSPPFSPSEPSSPGRMSPFNGHYDNVSNHHDHHQLQQHQHQIQESPSSSSPEFARKPKQSNNKTKQSEIPLLNHRQLPSPRSRTTGSSDHLDNGGSRQKSPDADFDSGFMGSESSRQSNQIRPFGYKRSGLDGSRTRTKEHNGPSQIPQAQRLQKGQRSSLHSSTALSQESPLESEGVASESEGETVTHVPVRKHSRSGNGVRQNGIGKPVVATRESHSKHTPPKLAHIPPQQSTVPSSKRHQRHSQAATPIRTTEQYEPSQKDPPSRQMSKDSRRNYKHEKSKLENGYKDHGLHDDYITPTSLPNSATKTQNFRPSSDITRPNRTKTRPHRTTPRAMNDSGSEVTRSSAKSEAMQALQDQIDDMKRQMQNRNEAEQQKYHKQPRRVPSRTPVREQVDFGKPSGRRPSVAESNKSEALQALRQELEDIKGQLRQKENTPVSSTDDRPISGQRLGQRSEQRSLSGHQSTPLRDNLRETLRSQYIPKSPSLRDSPSNMPFRDSYSKTPVRDSYSRTPLRHSYLRTPLRDTHSRTRLPQSPMKAKYQTENNHESPYRTDIPPRLRVSDLDTSPPPPQRYTSHTGEGAFVSTRTEACPMCGGSGSHTHGQYQHSGVPESSSHPAAAHPPPPMQSYPQPQPPPTMHLYPQSPPQAPPAMHSYPQSPPQATPTMQSYPQSPPHGYPYAPPVITSTPIVNPPYQPMVNPVNQSTINPANQTMPNPSYATMPPQYATTNGHVPPQPVQQYASQNGTHQQTYTSTGQTQPTVIHIRDDPAQVVYVTPSRRKGRYYARDESSSSSNDDDVELYYRRTPRSTSNTPRSARSASKSILRKNLHSEVTFVDDGLDKSLDSAVSMARRLKRSSHRLVSSTRDELSRSTRESRLY